MKFRRQLLADDLLQLFTVNRNRRARASIAPHSDHKPSLLSHNTALAPHFFQLSGAKSLAWIRSLAAVEVI